ncbi:MAG: response regulator transcription factor [Hyphomicrobiales bacterium]|nr:response regulator transcription factor [Hyphomicrobiales bacterium]
MYYNWTCVASADTSGATRFLGIGEDDDLHRPYAKDSAKSDGFIAVIESRTFLRECIRRSMQSAFSVPVVTYSTLAELAPKLRDRLAGLIVLSLMGAGDEESADALKELPELVSSSPVVVLASNNDVELARAAMRCGAKGYIPVTMGFEIVVEAVRLILSGGTYVPPECLLSPTQPRLTASPASSPASVLSRRELAVVRAIQQSKSNKIIAYELNMCESTVKVHVRNIMKKLNAKNRTEVAMKTAPFGASTDIFG